MATKQRDPGSNNRGFGSMDKDKQKEISAKGGQASHSGGNSRPVGTRGASGQQSKSSRTKSE